MFIVNHTQGNWYKALSGWGHKLFIPKPKNLTYGTLNQNLNLIKDGLTTRNHKYDKAPLQKYIVEGTAELLMLKINTEITMNTFLKVYCIVL